MSKKESSRELSLQALNLKKY